MKGNTNTFEQVGVLHAPLIRQLRTFAKEFTCVQVVAQVGNHGHLRASGTTSRVNADLLLYKSIRNTIATLVEEGVGWAERVNFLLGESRAYRNFPLRGGELRGHLRHGQNRKPQAETSARELDWKNTLIDHDFDLAYLGHHHVSGRIPWSGPPVFVSGSPKPGGEFVDKIGGSRSSRQHTEIAHVHGVSDDGLTGSYPIDTRHYPLRSLPMTDNNRLPTVTGVRTSRASCVCRDRLTVHATMSVHYGND